MASPSLLIFDTNPPPRLGADGVLGPSSQRVLYAPYAPSSLSLFSLMDLKIRPRERPSLSGPHLKSICSLPGHLFSLPGHLKIDMFAPRTSEIQYFLSPDHYNSIFSFSGPLKFNIFSLWTTKIQYCLSPDHKNSIFSVSGPLEFNVFFLWTTRIQYLLSLDD